MRYLSTFFDKLILQERGRCPRQRDNGLFLFDKIWRRHSSDNKPTISKSVLWRLSLSKNGNFFSNLVKQPLTFVVIAEGRKGPSRKERAATWARKKANGIPSMLTASDCWKTRQLISRGGTFGWGRKKYPSRNYPEGICCGSSTWTATTTTLKCSPYWILTL